MNKYIYARTYLRLLLILTVVVVIAGLSQMCFYLTGVVSDYHGYQIAKNSAAIVNTKGLVNELEFTSVVVSSFTHQPKRYEFATALKKWHIESSEAAQLRYGQIDGFEWCLGVARNDSRELKSQLLEEFLATLNDIENIVRSVLNTTETGSTNTASGTSVAGESHAPAESSEPRQQLLSPEALAQIQFDELNAAVSFLRKGPENDVHAYISPQAGMRTAADELQALVEFIRAYSQVVLQEERQVHFAPDKEQLTTGTEPRKVAVLQHFINQLVLCGELAKVNVSRGWILDGEIEKAENSIMSFRTEQSERLASLRSDMWHNATLAGGAVLSTAIVALILLIIRDFLSALIDTAINTGETANAVDRLRQRDTEER
jgi:hypothetical protein